MENGFYQGPAAGERYRVSDIGSTGGLALEKRLPAGTIATFYVGKDGQMLDADEVNLIGDGKERIWLPENDQRRNEARAILQEMGALALTDPKRAALKSRLKALVTGASNAQSDTDPTARAPAPAPTVPAPAGPAQAGQPPADRAAGATGDQPAADAKPALNDAGDRWTRMPAAERSAVLDRTAAKDKAKARIVNQPWDSLADGWRRAIARSMGELQATANVSRETPPAPQEESGVSERPQTEFDAGLIDPDVDERAPQWAGRYDQVRRAAPNDTKGWRLLGKNDAGEDVLESGGLRRVRAGEYTVTELAHKPKNDRYAEFKTVQELEQVRGPAEQPRDEATGQFVEKETKNGDTATPDVRMGAQREAGAEAAAPNGRSEQAGREPDAQPAGQGSGNTAQPVASVQPAVSGGGQPSQQTAAVAASKNTIFTDDMAAAARARLKSKLGRLGSGIDPEMLQDGIVLAGYHVEKGARTFAAFARAMLDDMGEAIRPYLKQFYMAVKYDPRAGAVTKDMSTAAFVEEFDLDAIAAPATGADDGTAATRDMEGSGQGALGGEPASDVRAPEQPRQAGQRADGRGGSDGRGDGQPAASGADVGTGVGAGADDVPVPARRARQGQDAGNRGVPRAPRPAAGPGIFDDAGREAAPVAPNAEPVPAPQFKPQDFTITDELELGEGGQKTKFKNNVAAIRLVRELEDSGRRATPDEQAV